MRMVQQIRRRLPTIQSTATVRLVNFALEYAATTKSENSRALNEDVRMWRRCWSYDNVREADHRLIRSVRDEHICSDLKLRHATVTAGDDCRCFSREAGGFFRRLATLLTVAHCALALLRRSFGLWKRLAAHFISTTFAVFVVMKT